MKRPTTVIMADDWFGHRLPDGSKFGDKDEWIEWDHALASAAQTIEDYSDEYGILAWHKDDAVENEGYLVFDAVRKIDPFQAAKEGKTSGKNYKAQPGEYFVPRITSRRNDGSRQTFRQWVESQIEESE